MNTEPPAARFQVEHQPRRPGYARRSARFFHTFLGNTLKCFIGKSV